MLKSTLKLLALIGISLAPAWAQDLMPMSPAYRAAPASAPQFTFRVPVHLTAIQTDTHAFINCRPLRRSTVMAEWIQEVPLDAGGNFNGTVVVAGSLPAGADPSSVDSYSCMLRLQGPGEGHPTTPCFGESCPSWWHSRPGTLFRPAVEGSMPR